MASSRQSNLNLLNPPYSRFFVPASMICRLSIVKRELKQAIESENANVDDHSHNRLNEDLLIDRCVDIAVGAVGTSSALHLIGTAYFIYKKQCMMSDRDRERAARKHFALKYLSDQLSPEDRIFCYIMFKLPSAVTIQTKMIRETIMKTKCADLMQWRDSTYSTVTSIPCIELHIKIVLQHLYIASFRSLLHDRFRLIKEKDIECIVIYSEFSDFGFDVRKALTLFDKDAILVVNMPSITSIPLDVFVQIHRWRTKEQRVCVACDTDGLTVSGLLTAHYLALITKYSVDETIKAIKLIHRSFVPEPQFEHELCDFELLDEQRNQLALQVMTSSSMKMFDERMIHNLLYEPFNTYQ